jgi:hypothetical protein
MAAESRVSDSETFKHIFRSRLSYCSFKFLGRLYSTNVMLFMKQVKGAEVHRIKPCSSYLTPKSEWKILACCFPETFSDTCVARG